MPAGKNGNEFSKRSYLFGDFFIDRGNFRLYEGNDIKTLPPRAFDVLFYLIENRERVVEKQELFDHVWQAHVSKDALRGEIKGIRQVLGDDAAKPRYIQTVPKRGYRFIAEVRIPDHDRSSKVLPDVSRAEIGPEGEAVEEVSTDAPSAEPERNTINTQISDTPIKVVAIGVVALGLILLMAVVSALLKNSLPVLPAGADDFDRLLNAYNLRHEVLTQNCYFQALLVIIGISLIRLFGTNKTRITALGTVVSPSFLHFIIAPVLVYLWIEFGFALDDLIKYRAEAWQYLSSIGDPHNLPLIRRAVLFNDSGFMDGWFMCFRPDEHAISTNFLAGTAFFFSLIYGTLFSLNHAYVAIGLRTGAARFFPKTTEPSSPAAFLMRFLPWFSWTLLFVSHLQFRFGGKHPNWIQPLIGLGTVIFGYLLSRAMPAAHVTGPLSNGRNAGLVTE